MLLVCAMLLLVPLLNQSCNGDDPKDEQSICGRELQQARVLRLASESVQESSIVHSNRVVGDLRLDGLFTTIERRGYVTELGTYDSVWVPEKSCYFEYLEYRFHHSYRTLDFVATWPMGDLDTLPVAFYMVERWRPYNADSTTTVTTNLKSSKFLNEIAGVSIDTLKQRQWNVAISYALLGSQPMKFFTQIRIGGYPLSLFSPESSIVY